MKHSILFFLLLLTIFSFGQSQKLILNGMNMDSLLQARQIEAIGKPLPPFTTIYKNKIFTNKNFKGKIVFLNFWFAACPPCMAELAELNKLYDTLKSNERFEFISFTFEKRKVIEEISKKYNLHYKVYSLTSADCNRLIRNSSFPNSMLIDSRGIVKFMKAGGSKDQKEIQTIIFTDYYPKILAEL